MARGVTYVIRQVDATDLDVARTLERLHRQTFTDGSPVAPTGHGYWWLVYFGGEPVAFAGMYPSVRWPNVGYLCRSGVLKAHRGHRLQRRLLLVRERKARALGWAWLVTDTYSNPVSSNNLISRGYRMYAPRKRWGFDGAAYWRKQIAPTGTFVRRPI